MPARSGRSLCGVREAVLVTGFRADLVEQILPRITPPGMRVRPRFNPFYKVADNLASCWMVREDLVGPVLILNGDTLFEPAVARRLLAARDAPITVTIDRKAAYDDDDMKVATRGDELMAIGKKLPAERVTGESIGFLRLNAAGSAAFVAELEHTMRTLEGAGLWYLSAIHRLANQGLGVRVESIESLQWAELDYPADLAQCLALARSWVAIAPQEAQAAASTG
jgi:choline kinase